MKGKVISRELQMQDIYEGAKAIFWYTKSLWTILGFEGGLVQVKSDDDGKEYSFLRSELRALVMKSSVDEDKAVVHPRQWEGIIKEELYDAPIEFSFQLLTDHNIASRSFALMRYKLLVG